MVDTIIEVMEDASQHTFKDGLTMFRAQNGEVLPSNLKRNVSGFLVRKDDVSFKADSRKLFARIALLQDQLVIAQMTWPPRNIVGHDRANTELLASNDSLNTKGEAKEEREMEEERGEQRLEERPKKDLLDEGGKVEIKSKE